MFASSIPGVTTQRTITFILCFFQYVFIHCTRSTWSYVSGDMVKQGYFSSNYLGYINFAFLFFYGLAISCLGQFGDRMNLRIFILAGTFTTSVIFTIIGVMIQIQEKKNYLYLILQIINGISQSTAWPGLLAILNNWFVTDKKIVLLGFFAAGPNVGDIFGDIYSGSLIGRDHLPLYAPVYLAAVSLFIISFLNAFFLQNAPSVDIKRLMIEEYEKNKVNQLNMDNQQLTIAMIEQKFEPNLNTKLDDNKNEIVQSQLKIYEEKEQLNYFTAWFVPNVAFYALSFGCVKAVYYILTFWLPAYLDSKNVPDVAWITAQTDVGSIPGGILVCLIGFYFNKRAVIIVPSLWIGTIIMISINYSGSLKHEIAGYISLVFLTGLFIGGCYNNISAALTVELSNQPELKKNKQATTTVVSVIMGFGAMFAAINQLIVPYVESYLFLYCGGVSIIGGIILIPLVIREIQRMRLNSLKKSFQ
ncbi:unnamed protein product [Paramecium primaurelia]|uniref:Major facilitator superfamily (MFS) profile domain-containing protein n=1 Tax=Paramecium primaurelia TaxID=5886 RepID=A0A8S1N7B3_PARPR|nr:unnamed protein product [Paramecium primaurelia]